MEATISLRVEKPVLAEISKIEKKWQTDRSEVIRRLLDSAIKEWNIKNALEQLSEQRISIGKAAEECGIYVWEMMELARGKNIDWAGYTKEDLEKDIKVIQ